MTPTKISYTTRFGETLQQYQCPNCGDIYMLADSEVHDHVTDCWKCGELYLQKIHLTCNFKFVREASFRTHA